MIELTTEQIDNLGSIRNRVATRQSQLARNAGIEIKIGYNIPDEVGISIEPSYASLYWNYAVSLNFSVKVFGVHLFTYSTYNDLGMNKYPPEEIVDGVYSELPSWWLSNKHNYSDEYREKVENLISEYSQGSKIGE